MLYNIVDSMQLKPYFSEVHYQKVHIHLGPMLKMVKTPVNPFEKIKELDPESFK